MMNLTLWDHAFAALVFVVFPIYTKFTFPAELARIRDGGEAARIGAYKNVIVTWLIFSLYVLLLWVFLDRAWGELGLQQSDPLRTIVGFMIAAAIVIMILLPMRGILQSPSRHGELGSQLGDLVTLMPRSRNDLRWFTVLSANAGISEELIFRGYLIWYLQHFIGLWPAAVTAVLFFGLAHAYQGKKQIPGILFVSAAATGLYLYTGSLLVPILFHFAVDAVQGFYIAKIQNAQAATI